MESPLAGRRLAVLGLGKMGGILLDAFLRQELISRDLVRATVHHEHRVRELRDHWAVDVSTDNGRAVEGADVVLLCVKPRTVRGLAREIAPHLTPGALLISVAASVPTFAIEEELERFAVVRAMPNTPCVIGRGMTGISSGRHAKAEHLEITRGLFDSVGRSVVVDERHMDAVTGLSASGPAFIYVILESLAEAGVKVGLPREISTLLAAQTVLGAADMVLRTNSHPALLKDEVTTPAGCTVDGILELEEGKLRVTLIKAVVKATQRAKELMVSD